MESRKQKFYRVKMGKFFTFSNLIFFFTISSSPEDLYSVTLVAVYQFGSSFAYSGLAYKPRIPQTLQHWTIYILVSVGFWCLWSVVSCKS